MPFGQESDDRGEDQKREGILPWLLQVVLAMCVFHPDDGYDLHSNQSNAWGRLVNGPDNHVMIYSAPP